MLGLAVGIILGAAGFYIVQGGIFTSSRTYTVHSISSHYPHQDEDTQTTLVVYRAGKSGHVKDILCHFPPGLELQQDADGSWVGINTVRVGPVAETYAFGEVGYICEIVE